MEIALGTYELNVSDDYINAVNADSRIQYIDTGISYNNLYAVKDFGNKKFINKISPFMTKYAEALINEWNNELGIPEIMLIHNARTDFTELAKKLVALRDKGVLNKIGVSNFSIEEIEKYHEITGEYPEYNEIEINPYYFNLELINYCKSKKIKIIAYCIFGGIYNAKRTIRDYSINYLLSFAGSYADIIIIRTDNLKHLYNDLKATNYIQNIIVSESRNKKVMTPMVYSLPKCNFINPDYTINDQEIFTYDNQNGVMTTRSFCCSDAYKNRTKDDRMEELVRHVNYPITAEIIAPPEFEFISEYREYVCHILRGMGWQPRVENGLILIYNYKIMVYLLDENEMLTKIYKPGYKLVIMQG